MKINYDFLAELANKYGDGFYLADRDNFENNYLELSLAFKKYYRNFNIAYSYKTNYLPDFCKSVDRLGGYAEVVSDLEMDIALKCGVKYERIIWNGPVKSVSRVQELLINGGTVNIDNLSELSYLEAFVDNNTDKLINLGIRLNFDVEDGVVSRFGIDAKGPDFDKVLDFFKRHDNVCLINLQCHFAKRNAQYWHARTKGMIDCINYVHEKLGIYPKRADLGGGIFGKMPESLKKQFKYDIPLYSDYGDIVGPLFKDAFPDENIELLVEPGTALAADSMKFVSKVESIKTVRDKTFVTLMGSQKNISMSGINPPVEVFSKRDYTNIVNDADFVGYTCIESDVLYHDFSGDIDAGDFVLISNCGSYSLVMKPPFIMANFSVLLIEGDELREVKRKENFADLFLTYRF